MVRKRDSFPNRTMIAKLYRIETIGEGNRARSSFEFDAVDIKAVNSLTDNELLNSRRINPFGLIRILTTNRKFKQFFQIEGEPPVGAWFELGLNPDRLSAIDRRLPAWHSALSVSGYNVRERGYAIEGRFLFDEEDGGPIADLGAAADQATKLARRLANSANFLSTAVTSRKKLKAIFAAVDRPARIQMRDVGQASLVSLLNQEEMSVLHYDAGWPVAFNQHTAPRRRRISVEPAPVVLSHWDWDHMHGYYKFPKLQKCKWIVPIQHLGPGAARVALRLKANGNLIAFRTALLKFGWGSMGQCIGSNLADSNQNGLALKVRLVSGELCLLVGDADYENALPSLRDKPLDCITVTHHGADFDGDAPTIRRSGSNLAMISYGKGNVYKHPKQRALRKHSRQGWLLKPTAKLGKKPRRDVMFP